MHPASHAQSSASGGPAANASAGFAPPDDDDAEKNKAIEEYLAEFNKLKKLPVFSAISGIVAAAPLSAPDDLLACRDGSLVALGAKEATSAPSPSLEKKVAAAKLENGVKEETVANRGQIPLKPVKTIVKAEQSSVFAKVCFAGKECKVVRRFPLPGGLSFKPLVALLSARFDAADVNMNPMKLRLEYRDDEGDYVTVSSDVEVAELYRIVETYNISPVHLRIAGLEGLAAVLRSV